MVTTPTPWTVVYSHRHPSQRQSCSDSPSCTFMRGRLWKRGGTAGLLLPLAPQYVLLILLLFVLFLRFLLLPQPLLLLLRQLLALILPPTGRWRVPQSLTDLLNTLLYILLCTILAFVLHKNNNNSVLETSLMKTHLYSCDVLLLSSICNRARHEFLFTSELHVVWITSPTPLGAQEPTLSPKPQHRLLQPTLSPGCPPPVHMDPGWRTQVWSLSLMPTTSLKWVCSIEATSSTVLIGSNMTIHFSHTDAYIDGWCNNFQ